MQELVTRNPGLDQRFQRVDATHFTAAIYHHGQKVCKGEGLYLSQFHLNHQFHLYVQMYLNHLLKLISSLVTDGEPLNTGSINGIWARITREHQLASNYNMPFLLIWCVAHRITLAWKSVCKDNPIVEYIINLASQLWTFFHNSGKRTGKLRNAAKANALSVPLQYPSYNSTRWVQYAFDLLNVVLRNWRQAMAYFMSENETLLAECWLNYDRLHLLTFLADVLQHLKTFQKYF